MVANRYIRVLFLLIVCIYKSEQRSTTKSESYVAAVMEFSPVYIQNDASSTLRENTNAYVTLISEANIRNADIIVFPEAGLTSLHLPSREKMDPWTTLVPATYDNCTPCNNQCTINVSDTLKSISCAAKANEIYVVINIVEKVPCKSAECPNDKVLYYNTNVVFDRTGKVIAKYRKTNLFVEPQINVTSVPEVITFDTDFGVTFGIIICFDILFKEPALTLTRTLGIRNIVFSTAWFSETPFLTAVQIQAGWSYSEDVNFLASGYNAPTNGNAGSGIYLGRQGIGKKIMPLNDHEEMLVFEVKKKGLTKSKERYQKFKEPGSNVNVLQPESNKSIVADEESKEKQYTKSNLIPYHDDLSIFETVPISVSTTQNVCQQDFCCNFSVTMTNVDPKTSYRLAVFNGVRTYVQIINVGTSTCAVIQCANDSISSCGAVQSSETTFSHIEITGTFQNDALIMPNSIDSSLLPLTNWQYDEYYHKRHVHVTMSLDVPTGNVVAFGLYSRVFDRDEFVNDRSNIIG